MSEYDDLQALIDAATPALAVDADVARAGADRFEAHAQWDRELRRRTRRTRRVLFAGGLAFTVLMGLISFEFFEAAQAEIASGSVGFNLWRILLLELVIALGVPLTLVGTAAFLVGRRRFGAQVVARAILWALTLLVGLVQVLAFRSLGGEPDPAGFSLTAAAVLVATMTCVGALWAAGEHGLRPPDGGEFRPVAFRRLLSLSLVMGLADAVIVGSVFVVSAALGRFEPLWLGLGLLLSVAAYGLARLRTWGLAAMALGNLAEVGLAAAGLLSGLGPLLILLMLTAAVQLLLPVPVYGAMLRGRAPAEHTHRWIRFIVPTLLVTITATALTQFVWAVAGRS